MKQMIFESFLSGFFADFLAGFFGIFIGLKAERWWNDRQKQNSIEEILPYVYVELCENLLLIDSGENEVVLNYWEVHKNLISD